MIFGQHPGEEHGAVELRGCGVDVLVADELFPEDEGIFVSIFVGGFIDFDEQCDAFSFLTGVIFEEVHVIADLVGLSCFFVCFDEVWVDVACVGNPGSV